MDAIFNAVEVDLKFFLQIEEAPSVILKLYCKMAVHRLQYSLIARPCRTH